MRLNQLTHLLLVINSAVDTGKYSDITIQEVSQRLEQEDMLNWLEERLGCDLYPLKGEAQETIRQQLLDICLAYAGTSRIRKTFLVENSGLCFLIALITELIQRKEWTE